MFRLKDHKVQEEYREFIQKKVSCQYHIFRHSYSCTVQLDWFWERYPTSSRTNDADSELRSRLDAQENVMIFFRAFLTLSPMTRPILLAEMHLGKLREGLISSDRKDLFALEGS